jgi:hypothetical protein
VPAAAWQLLPAIPVRVEVDGVEVDVAPVRGPRLDTFGSIAHVEAKP